MIYFDNAATTYPKPKEVRNALLQGLEAGGNPGRSSHALSRKAAELVYATREKLAALFGGEPEGVVFTQSATHALNLAIKGLVPGGTHVLLSEMEHNATLRPTVALAEKNGVRYDFFRVRGRTPTDMGSILADIKAKLKPDTAAIILCHRSNVLPLTLPLAPIGALAKEKGIAFIVDASQSAGSCPIHMDKCHITALCAPAHKGLYGVRGCGFAIFHKSLDPSSVATLIEGGSGNDSKSPRMPSLLPERLEAGTLGVEVIAALGSGIDFLLREGIDTIAEKEYYLTSRLKENLFAIPRCRLYMPREKASSLLLFNMAGKDPTEVAEYLDRSGFALREGLHCAPLAHRLIGTEETGALRASLGYFNTPDQVDALSYALLRMP